MTSTGTLSQQRRLKVVHYLGTIAMGGIENYTLTLCENLDRHRLDIMIACATENKDEIIQRASAVGVPVYGLETPGHRRFVYFRRLVLLTRLLRRERIDVLHVHSMAYSGINAILAAVLAGVPVIIETHHQGNIQAPSGLSRRLALWLKKRFVKRIIALYREQAHNLASVGFPPDRITVVPTGVDLSRFEQKNNASATDASIFRLAMVTRMAEGKGQAELLEAVALVAARYPHIRVLMIGDGPLRAEIEAQIERLGLSKVVEVPGWIPNDKVPEVLRTAQVIVLPTYFWGEAFPVTLVEGMAMGLAAVGTIWAGIPDLIVDGETGLLVKPRDVIGLARAIERLVAEPELAVKMGRNGHDRVHQLFSARIMGKTMTSIILSAFSSVGER